MPCVDDPYTRNSVLTTVNEYTMQAFLKEQVEGSRPDGYWVEAFPFHKGDKSGQNIVGYGLGTSEQASKIQMFINPFKDSSKYVVIISSCRSHIDLLA
jgi:hypothetical protein